jgi:hypothetical protein
MTCLENSEKPDSILSTLDFLFTSHIFFPEMDNVFIRVICDTCRIVAVNMTRLTSITCISVRDLDQRFTSIERYAREPRPEDSPIFKKLIEEVEKRRTAHKTSFHIWYYYYNHVIYEEQHSRMTIHINDPIYASGRYTYIPPIIPGIVPPIIPGAFGDDEWGDAKRDPIMDYQGDKQEW